MRQDLAPANLLAAYASGIFPMADEDEDGAIYWYDPDPRAILPLDGFHVSRSLLRAMKKNPFEIRVDTAFTAVMRACATPAPDREQTWITEELITAYTHLHYLGFAHSVEAWSGGKLVGGLYGVALQGLFAGESMFSRQTNASKIALVHLVQRMRQRGYQLLDVQFMTEHLHQFGAVEISKHENKWRLAQAMRVDANFGY